MAGSNPKSTNRQGSTGKAQELDKMARKTQSNGWEKLGLTEQGINRQSDTDTMRNRCADNQQNRQRQQVTGEGAGTRSPWSTKQTEAHGDKTQKEAAEHTAYDMQINFANLIT